MFSATHPATSSWHQLISYIYTNLLMNNNSLTLALVIPVYNEERHLNACLEAIAKQTDKPDKVIVVDNNSTDGSTGIAARYDFVTVVHEVKQGVYHARQTGFDAVRHDIIARIDADTILPPGWVARTKNLLDSPKLAAVTGPVSYYDMPFKKGNYFLDHLMRKFTFKWAVDSPFLYGSNMAIKKTAWQQVKQSLCAQRDTHEDIDLAIHLYRNKLNIGYKKNLLAKASGRRYNDPLSAFMSYLLMYRRTYRRHGLHSLAIYPAMFMWLLGYLFMWPWKKVWYAYYATKKNKLPFSPKPRKNPMSR